MSNLDQGSVSHHSRAQLNSILSNWRLTPATFAYKISKGAWIPAKHLLYISTKIALATAKGNGKIIISLPPRHGKTELCSYYTPSWHLEKYPEKRVILASYGADLSEIQSRRVRNLFTDPDNSQLLKTRLMKDAKAVDAFHTEDGGAMFAMGVGGPITGKGADLLLIDDYIKEIKEALSPTQRDYIWNWFVTTAYTRLEPGGTVVIIATRWHSDDLIGRIIKNLTGWEYIEVPAVANDHDLLGRTAGEPLFPQRYDLPKLADIKETLGNVFWQALYQQRPIDETTRITDSGWFKKIEAVPKGDRYKICRVWDLAATEDGGDYTCGALMIYDGLLGRTYIVDMKREQLSPGKVEKLVEETALEDGLECTICIEQEPGSSGKSLVAVYQSKESLRPYKVVPVPAVKNKVVRCQPMIAAVEAGKVWVVQGDWIKPFFQEFDAFPTGEYDDQVDVVGAGYTYLTGKKSFTASWGREDKVGSDAYAKKQNLKKVHSAFATMGNRSQVTFGRD